MNDDESEEFSSEDERVEYNSKSSLKSKWKYTKIEEYSLRQNTRDFLHLFIKSHQNIFTIESILFKLSKRNEKLDRDSYVKNILEFQSLCYTHHPRDILERIQQNRIGFNSPEYDIFNEMEQAEITKMNTKIEAVEGIYKCSGCGQSKTTQYALQLRSGDEPATIFISCMNSECRKKWREG
jgi:DNA-directed RNA polymerase subunit M/transcription elongation factor TFIIS